MKTPEQIAAGMSCWFEKRGGAKTIKARTDYQRGWDSAIMAAAEYVRRRQNYDETLALELHNLLMTPIEHNPGNG